MAFVNSVSNLLYSYKDDVTISTKDERIKILSDHSEHGFYELVIPDVKFSDAGIYKCVAKNSFGEATSQSNVTVTGKSWPIKTN